VFKRSVYYGRTDGRKKGRKEERKKGRKEERKYLTQMHADKKG
jgi:hypothetical protein